MRREPALLQTSRDQSKERISKVTVASDDASLALFAVLLGYASKAAAAHGENMLDIARISEVFWCRQYGRDDPTVTQHLRNVLVAPFLTNAIVGVIYLAGTGLSDGFLDAFHNSIVAFAVVNDDVTFAAINERFHKILTLSCNGNNGMNV